MRIARLVSVFSLAAFCAGCATWSVSNVDSSTADAKSASTAPPKVAGDVQITEADIVDQRYQSLGDITVTVNKTTLFHPNPTRELVNEKLKEKGAELGADAVILVRYGAGGMSLMSWNSLEGKGRAVKFIK